MSAHARTDGFQTLLNATATACGLDPSRLGTQEGVALAGHLTRAARAIWRTDEWPGTIKTEGRAYRDLFDAATSYAVDDEFYFEGDADTAAEYRKVTVPGSGAQMLTDAYSETLTGFVRSVPLQNAGDTTMREILSAWNGNPETEDKVQSVGYHLRGDAVVFAQEAPDVVYIRFRLPCPEFTISTWSSGTAYAPGDLAVVWPHCYMAMQASTGTGQGPASAPERWEIQDVPESIRDVVITDAARAWLRAQGHYAQAGALSREREDAFQQASQASGHGQGQQNRYMVANQFTASHRRQFHPRKAGAAA